MAIKNTTSTQSEAKFKFTEEELREGMKKLQAQRDASRARRNTPEFKAAQAARNSQRRERQNALKAAAAKLGLTLK
jgi:hypothetical protein